MTITIFHNPACGTSRNVLALIRNSGVEPVIVEYLKTPPGRARLLELITAMGVPVRDVLRRKGTPCDELKLEDPKWTDDQLHRLHGRAPDPDEPAHRRDAAGHPLVPSFGAVLDIMPSPQLAPFAKEDGEPVIDADGKRTGRRVAP